MFLRFAHAHAHAHVPMHQWGMPTKLKKNSLMSNSINATSSLSLSISVQVCVSVCCENICMEKEKEKLNIKFIFQERIELIECC